jgi:hypothetical protein
MIAGAATAGVSGALVLAQGMDVGEVLVNLTATNTVIGIGGRGDPTSSNVPAKLFGTVVPGGSTYIPIGYPAGYDLGPSRDAGVPVLHQTLIDNAGNPTTVVAYSEGTLVAEQEKRNLQAAAPHQAPLPGDPDFVQIASPFAGNGGIFGRFAFVPTFLIVDNMGPAEPTRFDTHYVVNEYDPYGDFPAYANPLSLANSALAIQYAHPDQYYNAIDPATSEKLGPDQTYTNSAGGIDTYTIYKNQQLPLLGPIRQGASLIGVSQYVEPELQLVEPTLRVLIDAGYTDRTNADPATPTQFSLITPPDKIIGAAAALPGAAQEGVTNFLGGAQSVSPLSTQPQNKSLAQGATPQAAPQATLPTLPKIEAPKLPELPKLPLLPKADLPKPDPALDALKLDPPKLPKLPITSRQTSSPNLGLLASGNLTKPKVFAGGGSAGTNAPSFGSDNPAGVLSGALKKLGGLAGGLTGDKKSEPAASSPAG